MATQTESMIGRGEPFDPNATLLQDRNLSTAWLRSAQANSSKTAVFWGETELSYSQLLGQSCWVANHLETKLDSKRGDRVALWLKNCPQFISVLQGTLLSGGVVVPINNFLKPDEVAHILQDAGANVLITDSSTEESVTRLKSVFPNLQILLVESIPAESVLQDIAWSGIEAQRHDLAVLIYTSGTTGRPKGAMLTHDNLLSNVESCRIMLQAVSFDRIAVLLPMFHSFMFTVGLLLPLLIGGSVVLIKSVHPPKAIFGEIFDRQATLLPAIPPLFRALAGASVPENCPLRLCVSGAAPLPLEILKEFNAKFSFPLLEGYGLSEASPVVSINPIPGPWKAGSIGTPIPGVEMSVQDDAGNMLPHGEVGEICVRGTNVMSGYWNQPDESAKVLKNGWLLTGDIGYGDSEGYYFITDRKKDMLLVNGINVYPREIEEILYQYPGIKEASVVGQPDSRKGEQPIAFVSAIEGATLNEKSIIDFLRERLANYKIPRHVHILAQLPRNATGKILKTQLREMLKLATKENDQV